MAFSRQLRDSTRAAMLVLRSLKPSSSSLARLEVRRAAPGTAGATGAGGGGGGGIAAEGAGGRATTTTGLLVMRVSTSLSLRWSKVAMAWKSSVEMS